MIRGEADGVWPSSGTVHTAGATALAAATEERRFTRTQLSFPFSTAFPRGAWRFFSRLWTLFAWHAETD